jgi:hypothetical protein
MHRKTKHVRKMVKIMRGGERFWCEVLDSSESGMTLRCDNDTIDPKSPKYNEIFEIGPDEVIFDHSFIQSTLSVIGGQGNGV